LLDEASRQATVRVERGARTPLGSTCADASNKRVGRRAVVSCGHQVFSGTHVRSLLRRCIIRARMWDRWRVVGRHTPWEQNTTRTRRVGARIMGMRCGSSLKGNGETMSLGCTANRTQGKKRSSATRRPEVLIFCGSGPRRSKRCQKRKTGQNLQSAVASVPDRRRQRIVPFSQF